MTTELHWDASEIHAPDLSWMAVMDSVSVSKFLTGQMNYRTTRNDAGAIEDYNAVRVRMNSTVAGANAPNREWYCKGTVHIQGNGEASIAWEVPNATVVPQTGEVTVFVTRPVDAVSETSVLGCRLDVEP